MPKKRQEVRFQKAYAAGSHSVRAEDGGHEIARVALSGHRIYKDWREAGPHDWVDLIVKAPEMALLLRRILGMHETKNCGAYNGEAVLSESVADEIRRLVEAKP